MQIRAPSAVSVALGILGILLSSGMGCSTSSTPAAAGGQQGDKGGTTAQSGGTGGGASPTGGGGGHGFGGGGAGGGAAGGGGHGFGGSGNGGAGGSGGGGSTGGPGGGAGSNAITCTIDTGPLTESDPIRRTLPFTLEPPAGGKGGVSGGPIGNSGFGGQTPAAGGAGGTSISGGPCTFPADPSAIAGATCSGVATVHVTSAGPVLQLDASTRLRWDTTSVPNAVAPPAVVEGQSVWIDYEAVSRMPCPFCEPKTASLKIRDHQGGQLLWVAMEGNLTGDIDAALATELFGVPFEPAINCVVTATAGCVRILRQEFDHVLETAPFQIVPHAVKTRVTTPNGDYELFWTASMDTIQPPPICEDGSQLVHDNGFAASRLSP